MPIEDGRKIVKQFNDSRKAVLDSRKAVLDSLNEDIKKGENINGYIECIRGHNINLSEQEKGRIIEALVNTTDVNGSSDCNKFLNYVDTFFSIGILKDDPLFQHLLEQFNKTSNLFRVNQETVSGMIDLINRHFSQKAPTMIRDLILNCSEDLQNNDFVLQALKENKCITIDRQVKWKLLNKLLFDEKGVFRDNAKNTIDLLCAVFPDNARYTGRTILDESEKQPIKNYFLHVINCQTIESNNKVKILHRLFELYPTKRNHFLETNMKCVIRTVQDPVLLKYLCDTHLTYIRQNYIRQNCKLIDKSYLRVFEGIGTRVIATPPLNKEYINTLNSYYKKYQEAIQHDTTCCVDATAWTVFTISIYTILVGAMVQGVRILASYDTAPDGSVKIMKFFDDKVFNGVFMALCAAMVVSVVAIIIIHNLPTQDLLVVKEMEKQEKNLSVNGHSGRSALNDTTNCAPPPYARHEKKTASSSDDKPPAYEEQLEATKTSIKPDKVQGVFYHKSRQ